MLKILTILVLIVTNKNFKNKDKTTRVRQNEYETPLSDQGKGRDTLIKKS